MRVSIVPVSRPAVSRAAVTCLAVSCLTVSCWLLAAPALADDEILEEVRDELWVDGPDAVQPGTGQDPEIAVDAAGNTIVTWRGLFAPGGDRADVFVRRFDSEDNPLEDPQMVNTTFVGEQDHPDVAVRDDGAYYVVWQSIEFDSDDNTDQRWVRGQFFDANGVKQGGEQLISQVSSGVFAYDLHASVAALTNGTFVVVWESLKGFGTDSQDCSGSAVGCGTYSIQARRVGTGGVPVGDQFQVNQDPDREQENPAVAPTRSGGFFVVWHSTNSIGSDDASGAVQGRRFHGNGNPAANELQINSTIAGTQAHADVASNGLGELLVVFETPNEYLVNNFTNVRGRWLDPQGNPQGSDFFLADIHPQEHHFGPRVAGGVDFFMAVWETGVQGAGSDNSDTAINGRIVLGPDQFEGGQFQVNAFEPGHQELAGIGGRHFHVMTAWSSRPTSAFEDDGSAVVGRGYRFCSFFCDDFESGTTDCWHAQVGR